MSIEEIKSEIENLTTKSLSEVIDFAQQVREQRDLSAAATSRHQMDVSEASHVSEPDEPGESLKTD